MPAPQGEGWTDARVESLKELWGKGLSASQIAGQFGDITRNAVIGKVHRLGLTGRSTTSRKLPHQKLRRLGNLRSSRPTPRPRPYSPPRILPTRPEPVVALPPHMIALMDLREGRCKWPFGDPKRGEFGFCGHSAEAQYCDAHMSAAYRPEARRRK